MTEEGVGYAGNEFRKFVLDPTGQTEDDCAAKCKNDDGCKFWSFGLNQKICYLKTSDAGRIAKDMVISGLKPCN